MALQNTMMGAVQYKWNIVYLHKFAHLPSPVIVISSQ